MRALMKTERLLLRWITPDDADRLTELASNWNVARMLARMPHPYPQDGAATWIATHEQMRARGLGSPYAITLDGVLVGVVGVERMDGRHGPGSNVELGYWLGEPYWGKGFATEAARAATHIGFADMGPGEILSGHFEENTASGNVLQKCGFRYTGRSVLPCMARGETLPARDMAMPRADWIAGLVAAA